MLPGCTFWLSIAVLGFLHPGAQSSKAQQRTVTNVVAVAKPKTYNGPAPGKVEFVGTIFVSRQPALVEYQWERSDGAKSAVRKVEVRHSGQMVTDTWEVGEKGKRLRVWERLHVLAPTGMTSAPAVATVFCRK